MSKVKATSTTAKAHTSLVKTTKQGGKVKTSTMNKGERRSHKKYRGQGH
jgi:hypothetical protein